MKDVFTLSHMRRRAGQSVAGSVALVSVAAFAAEGGQIEAAIGQLQTTITGYISLGITACVALLLVSMAGDIGIGVAKKWLRKGAN